MTVEKVFVGRLLFWSLFWSCFFFGVCRLCPYLVLRKKFCVDLIEEEDKEEELLLLLL